MEATITMFSDQWLICWTQPLLYVLLTVFVWVQSNDFIGESIVNKDLILNVDFTLKFYWLGCASVNYEFRMCRTPILDNELNSQSICIQTDIATHCACALYTCLPTESPGRAQPHQLPHVRDHEQCIVPAGPGRGQTSALRLPLSTQWWLTASREPESQWWWAKGHSDEKNEKTKSVEKSDKKE